MADAVNVAPREITDLVYRACRVAGCGASVSDTIAADVTYCEIHFASGIEGVLELIEMTPCSLREQAIEAQARNERGPHSAAEPGAAPTPFVLRCRSEAPLHSHRADSGTGDSGTGDSGTGDRDGAGRYREALANGVVVNAAAWERLEQRASDFLLAERIIDGS